MDQINQRTKAPLDPIERRAFDRNAVNAALEAIEDDTANAEKSGTYEQDSQRTLVSPVELTAHLDAVEKLTYGEEVVEQNRQDGEKIKQLERRGWIFDHRLAENEAYDQDKANRDPNFSWQLLDLGDMRFVFKQKKLVGVSSEILKSD